MKKQVTGLMVFAGAFSALAMDFAILARPEAVLVDGRPADGRVAVAADGGVTLRGGAASWVILRWKAALGKEALVLGSMWERTYGDSAWRRVDDATAPRGGAMAWYFLATDGVRTDGYGVQVQPNAFARWKVAPNEVELLLDVRAGSYPVELGARDVCLCTLVSRRGAANESAFSAGQAFCRMMCPKPRLPKEPVYGYNDWYCAYGNNTASNFLADATCIVALLDRGERAANRPFVIVDDGWQNGRRNEPTPRPDARWTTHCARWGMDMGEFARRVKALDARPGLWYSPFVADAGFTDVIDPTDPDWERRIRRDVGQFGDWGMEIVKIDFITYDWCKVWGFELEDSPVKKPLPAWKDRSHTSAEVVKRLYTAMRAAAGDRMYIIGCNAIDHFAAGLFELQRTGDDTSGREWARTRKMGPNTLGMRAIHNRTFYLADGDCVGLVKGGDVPWEKNRQWLDLVAKSGTALFLSWKRQLAENPEVATALSTALKEASRPRVTGEPLDWLETLRPRRWRFGLQQVEYEWD